MSFQKTEFRSQNLEDWVNAQTQLPVGEANVFQARHSLSEGPLRGNERLKSSLNPASRGFVNFNRRLQSMADDENTPCHSRTLLSGIPACHDGTVMASIEKNVNRKIVTPYKRWWLLFLDIPTRFPDSGAVAEIVVL